MTGLDVVTSVAETLSGIVGERWVIQDKARLLAYSSDGLPSYKKAPGLAVLPGSQEEVIAIVRALAKAKIPFVPRGAGTGLSGGALADAADNTVLIGLHRLKKISIDLDKRTATVEPGVVNLTLNKLLAPHGLMYAPDPSSESACTIGGNVAENAGGPHCLKYGVTLNHVAAVTVVLPSGDIVKLGNTDDPPQTYDLLGAFIGSEGCFGIALDVTVKLTEKPPVVTTLLADFMTVDAAARTTSAIIASGIIPAALEFMDGPAIRIVESSIYAAGYPADAEAVLLIELDGYPDDVEADAARVKELCTEARNVSIARSDAERAKLWQGRKKAFGAMGRLAPHLMVQDAVIPRSKLPEIIAGIHEIADRYNVTICNIFHAGDGNLHPNIAYNADNAEESERVHNAMSEVMRMCVNAGGSITGEHGVGLDKLGYMELMFTNETLTAMCDLRSAFDPEKRANPGKVVPVRSCREWHATKSHVLPKLETTNTKRETSPQTLRARDAVLSTKGLCIQGSGTWTEALNWIESSEILSMREDTGIVEYSPADFVIIVRAGTSLRELSGTLAVHNQRLPWNFENDHDTIGAIAATGAYGVRNQVLGLEFVTGRGDVVRSGGKVIKNVAGFDLTRLLIGSWGTLGVITEVTLRVHTKSVRRVEGVLSENIPQRPRRLGASQGFAVFETPETQSGSGASARGRSHVDTLNSPCAQRPRFTHDLQRAIRHTFDPRNVLNPGLITQ